MNYIIMPGLKFREGVPVGIKPEKVVNAVCEYFDITTKMLFGKSRERHICEPRHIAMYVIRKHCKKGTIFIGNMFGRDHTSVCHACQVINNKLDTEPAFKQELQQVFSNI